jgi:F0F1-type ATP synthase membrane subunit b/b'
MAVSTGESSENRTVYRLRWIGYGLLLFALIDVIHILASIRSEEPTWLLAVIGQLVERVVVPILGFTLVFFGEFYGRKGAEKNILQGLRWLCLLLAFIYFLMVPPVILQSMNVKSQVEQMVGPAEAQNMKLVEQQMAQLTQLEGQLKQATPEDIQRLASQLTSLGVNNVDPKKPEEVKSQIQARIKTFREQLETAKGQVKNKIQGEASNRIGVFVKNAVKWSFGAIVAGGLFIYLWKSSNWA